MTDELAAGTYAEFNALRSSLPNEILILHYKKHKRVYSARYKEDYFRHFEILDFLKRRKDQNIPLFSGKLPLWEVFAILKLNLSDIETHNSGLPYFRQNKNSKYLNLANYFEKNSLGAEITDLDESLNSFKQELGYSGDSDSELEETIITGGSVESTHLKTDEHMSIQHNNTTEISVIEGTNGPESNLTDQEEELSESEYHSDSGALLTEVETPGLIQGDHVNSSIKNGKVFLTEFEMEESDSFKVKGIIPIWAKTTSRLDEIYEVSSFCRQLHRCKDIGVTDNDEKLIYSALTQSRRSNIYDELDDESSKDLDKFTAYILEAYGPTNLEKRNSLSRVTQKNGESGHSLLRRIIMIYFQNLGINKSPSLENIMKDSHKTSDIVYYYVNALADSNVRKILNSKLAEIELINLAKVTQQIQSAYTASSVVNSVNNIELNESSAFKDLSDRMDNLVLTVSGHENNSENDPRCFVCGQIEHFAYACPYKYSGGSNY